MESNTDTCRLRMIVLNLIDSELMEGSNLPRFLAILSNFNDSQSFYSRLVMLHD